MKKRLFYFAMAAAMMFGFTACDPDDNNGGGGNGGDDNNNYSQLIVGTWLVDNMTYNGMEMTPQDMNITMNQNGTGEVVVGGVHENNYFSWTVDGSTLTVSPDDSNSYDFNIASLTLTECSMTGNVVPGTDMTGAVTMHMTKVNGDNPGPGPGPGGDTAAFPAGTGWEMDFDTTITEIEDSVTYDMVLDLTLRLNFAPNGSNGSMAVTGTMSAQVYGMTVYSENVNENEPFTWTYNPATNTGEIINSGVDDNGQPYEDHMPFTYNSSNNTIVIDIPEDPEGESDFFGLTQLVFHRVSK